MHILKKKNQFLEISSIALFLVNSYRITRDSNGKYMYENDSIQSWINALLLISVYSKFKFNKNLNILFDKEKNQDLVKYVSFLIMENLGWLEHMKNIKVRDLERIDTAFVTECLCEITKYFEIDYETLFNLNLNIKKEYSSDKLFELFQWYILDDELYLSNYYINTYDEKYIWNFDFKFDDTKINFKIIDELKAIYQNSIWLKVQTLHDNNIYNLIPIDYKNIYILKNTSSLIYINFYQIIDKIIEFLAIEAKIKNLV
ncbi:hypothetical protein [Spiroplasma sp. SV19]|uniref:hypothetical protein n=1 Tax=Spiroplasma sp. SV19 TaxID=2570468 RepID=UPI0024B7EDC5|nr:hypothetical protein [Spiroplasma sp. SV19]WHQ37372.1 hypothetical protein E7Y35_05845 [Spiroplasma sp. SV19]